uniref:ShKT domain-containing protein n=1 Tax=Rhabditophanes sp. KR3021 TaxID=114890 RepID=A0AC35TJD0_9BILA
MNQSAELYVPLKALNKAFNHHDYQSIEICLQNKLTGPNTEYLLNKVRNAEKKLAKKIAILKKHSEEDAVDYLKKAEPVIDALMKTTGCSRVVGEFLHAFNQPPVLEFYQLKSADPSIKLPFQLLGYQEGNDEGMDKIITDIYYLEVAIKCARDQLVAENKNVLYFDRVSASFLLKKRQMVEEHSRKCCEPKEAQAAALKEKTLDNYEQFRVSMTRDLFSFKKVLQTANTKTDLKPILTIFQDILDQLDVLNTQVKPNVEDNVYTRLMNKIGKNMAVCQGLVDKYEVGSQEQFESINNVLAEVYDLSMKYNFLDHDINKAYEEEAREHDKTRVIHKILEARFRELPDSTSKAISTWDAAVKEMQSQVSYETEDETDVGLVTAADSEVDIDGVCLESGIKNQILKPSVDISLSDAENGTRHIETSDDLSIGAMIDQILYEGLDCFEEGFNTYEEQDYEESYYDSEGNYNYDQEEFGGDEYDSEDYNAPDFIAENHYPNDEDLLEDEKGIDYANNFLLQDESDDDENFAQEESDDGGFAQEESDDDSLVQEERHDGAFLRPNDETEENPHTVYSDDKHQDFSGAPVCENPSTYVGQVSVQGITDNCTLAVADDDNYMPKVIEPMPPIEELAQDDYERAEESDVESNDGTTDDENNLDRSLSESELDAAECTDEQITKMKEALARYNASYRDCKNGDCCDLNVNCQAWARRGECDQNVVYMSQTCRKSCRVCKTHLSVGQENKDSTNLSGCNEVQTSEISTRIVLAQSQHMQQIKEITQCGSENPSNNCSVNLCYHKQFRTLDGTCNNLATTNRGASFTNFVRLLPPLYEDGVGVWAGKSRLFRPNARKVTREILTSTAHILTNNNQMVMQFGQFLAHDITNNNFDNFCACNSINENCMSVPLARDDPKTPRFLLSCIPITRSIPSCQTGKNGVAREQMNRHTSYIDASMVYGSTDPDMKRLKDGHLLKTQTVNGHKFAPFSIGDQFDGMSTGDGRSALFVGLATMHTVFVRLHNTISNELRTMNRHWSLERSFQETRKIVGAIIQRITYYEFLPALLGESNINSLLPKYTGYKKDVDSSISNEFAAAAFRLHGMISDSYPLVNENFQTIGNARFIQNTNKITTLLGAGVDAVIRGLISKPLKKPQRIEKQVTEELFDATTDLASINIVRGRDHGLRSYNDYRRMCQLPLITNFREWNEVSDDTVKSKVAELYRDPENIDLYLGSIIEETLAGSMVGPTFTCIITEQFKRLRDGDRFYFENSETFTPQQTAAIKKMSLASLLCLTGENYQRIPKNAFKTDKGENAVSCDDIAKLDFEPWRST